MKYVSITKYRSITWAEYYDYRDIIELTSHELSDLSGEIHGVPF